MYVSSSLQLNFVIAAENQLYSGSIFYLLTLQQGKFVFT